MESIIDAKPNGVSVSLGVFSDFPGVNVSVSDGDAGDYLAMLAAQLAAVHSLMAMEGFELQSAETKTYALCLASGLADKVNNMIPIALREASKNG